MWRCPHCGTPQAESSRCWVCKRSSTSCGTCRHFRRAIAGHLGYCGLDRHRTPLVGDELRGCWEEAPEVLVPDLASARRIVSGGPVPPGPAWTERPRLEFVPLEDLRPAAGGDEPRPRASAVPPAPPAPSPAVLPPRDPLLGFWGEDA